VPLISKVRYDMISGCRSSTILSLLEVDARRGGVNGGLDTVA